MALTIQKLLPDDCQMAVKSREIDEIGREKVTDNLATKLNEALDLIMSISEINNDGDIPQKDYKEWRISLHKLGNEILELNKKL